MILKEEDEIPGFELLTNFLEISIESEKVAGKSGVWLNHVNSIVNRSAILAIFVALKFLSSPIVTLISTYFPSQ